MIVLNAEFETLSVRFVEHVCIVNTFMWLRKYIVDTLMWLRKYTVQHNYNEAYHEK